VRPCKGGVDVGANLVKKGEGKTGCGGVTSEGWGLSNAIRSRPPLALSRTAPSVFIISIDGRPR
jgi:hypothetical protein